MASAELIPVNGFRLEQTGLVVQGQPSFEDWSALGEKLRLLERTVHWWIGDWLNYGEQRWGEMYSQAIDSTGFDYQTLRTDKYVSSQFELLRRRNNLSWSHHREVAALPADLQDEALAVAESENLSSRGLRLLVKEYQRQQENGQVVEPCTVDDLRKLIAAGRTFGTLYADPPWQYDNQSTRAATDNHYKTLTVDEITELPVKELAAPESHLWLWTTNAFLFDCPRLFDKWGFEFKSSYVWVKPQIGIGNYLRNSHEFLLLAVKGELVGKAKDVRSWGEFDRTEHSHKPERIRREVVEAVSPGPRLELFGRRPADGWVVWGDAIERGLFDKDVKEL